MWKNFAHFPGFPVQVGTLALHLNQDRGQNQGRAVLVCALRPGSSSVWIHHHSLFTLHRNWDRNGELDWDKNQETVSLAYCPCNVKASTQYHTTHLFPVPVPITVSSMCVYTIRGWTKVAIAPDDMMTLLIFTWNSDQYQSHFFLPSWVNRSQGTFYTGDSRFIRIVVLCTVRSVIVIQIYKDAGRSYILVSKTDVGSRTAFSSNICLVSC